MTLLPALSGAFGDAAAAVTMAEGSCSWGQLAARADVVGRRIAGMDAVAVRASAEMNTVVAVVAALAAGVPAVLVPPDAGPAERHHILADSGSTAVLGDTGWDDVTLPVISLDAGSCGRSRHGDGSALDEPRPRGESSDRADRPALIVYTSGTTGLPKGAKLSAAAIAADLDGLADAWAWTADDHLVHGLPLFHVHGLVLGVLGALRTGSTLTHTGCPTPVGYAAVPGTLYFGVPTVWSRVCADRVSATGLRSARLLVSGSAALPASVFHGLTELTGAAPVERYGMTETLITLSTRHDSERAPGSVGWPIVGVEARVVGDDGAPAGHGTTGHLQVRGKTLFDGYVSGGSATDVTDDGWFVTGDSARIGVDGGHRIVGRTSIDIIKTGGFKVGAGEVENVLLDHPDVAEVAVVGVADDDLGQRIVAYVVERGRIDPAALSAFVSARLTSHKCPREIRVVDALPRNAMGKVLKALLGTAR